MKKTSLLAIVLIFFSLINANESLTSVLEERANAVKKSKTLYLSKILPCIGIMVADFYLFLLKDDINQILRELDKTADQIIPQELESKNILPYDTNIPCIRVNKPKFLNCIRAMHSKMTKELNSINAKLSSKAALLEKSNANYFMALHDADIVS